MWLSVPVLPGPMTIMTCYSLDGTVACVCLCVCVCVAVYLRACRSTHMEESALRVEARCFPFLRTTPKSHFKHRILSQPCTPSSCTCTTCRRALRSRCHPCCSGKPLVRAHSAMPAAQSRGRGDLDRGACCLCFCPRVSSLTPACVACCRWHLAHGRGRVRQVSPCSLLVFVSSAPLFGDVPRLPSPPHPLPLPSRPCFHTVHAVGCGPRGVCFPCFLV